MSNPTTPTPFDTVGFCIDYEQGHLKIAEIVHGFQQLINSGLCWKLQGHYGRTAKALLEAGDCTQPLTLNELVQVSDSYTVVLPGGTLVIVQHGQYDDLVLIQTDDDKGDDLLWHLYGRETKAQVVAALEVLLNEGATWEPWHVTTAIEEAA